ncbi:hypothetical protein B0H11DRAFT_2250593 [Mycena galericulata]|nr:hypothetical protein B0H11DRAFT_2250593 [Mycena galericulata]
MSREIESTEGKSEAEAEAEVEVLLAICADAAREMRAQLQIHASRIKRGNQTGIGARSSEHNSMRIRAAAARVARAAERCELVRCALASLVGEVVGGIGELAAGGF